MKLITLYLLALLQFSNGNPIETNAPDPTVEVEQIMKEWVLVAGWLNQDSLVFEQKDSTIHNIGLYKIFTFQKENKLDYRMYNPNKYMLCGVGMVGLQNTSWQLDEDGYMVLHAQGERWGESQFEYETRYFIEHISDTKLKLVVDRRLKNVEKEF